MVYNLMANLVNVVLNYLLINGHYGFPRLELAGASLATIIGRTVAFGLALRVVLKETLPAFAPQRRYQDSVESCAQHCDHRYSVYD